MFKFNFKREHKHHLLASLAILGLIVFGTIYLFGQYLFLSSNLERRLNNGSAIKEYVDREGDPLITKTPSLEDYLDGPIISATDPNIGVDNSKVTVVQFSDFDCKFCQKQENVLKLAQQQFGDKVKFIWKDYPDTDKNSISYQAAIAARCAQMQGKFWQYHDELYKSSKISAALFLQIADLLGMNKGQFENCLKSETASALVNDNIEEANALGITGVPFIYINKQEIMGEASLEDLKQMINIELTRDKETNNK